MSGQTEHEFVKAFVNILASQPVTFHDDFQEQPEKTLKKVPVVQLEVPPPPELKKEEAHSSSAPSTIQITFKSLKPPFSITIPISPTDPISTIKTQIADQPHAPPASAQRLLLKGKALADAKLLKEYNVQNDDTINLMVKPGVEWDPIAKPKDLPSLLLSGGHPLSLDTGTASLTPALLEREKKRGHSRIPSVVLSTPASPLEKPQDIQLVDGDGFTLSTDMSTESSIPQSTYRTAVSQPEYWQNLLTFLRSRFSNPGDASIAFEDYLAASKGVLTANEVAKIRDSVGVTGMAGT